ncbi:8006de8a-6956-46fc-8d90-4182a46a371c-CDS [Sclerotinia trifoliorum]|uniref:8006de8a-6956-46fc-8d90-4182a46a371c-CDS n=1 Tax=Sclerotinia trifoliorum TaxID=28548 RepID=A0A8H2ZP63_9HELO|nr:8006de8a-6956-46fc-8d90-4182a46a371c-CDS [Sclerotinia trifoliorum]
MMPRAVPIYPGPLSMTEHDHYNYVEAQATITEDGNRIIFEEGITVNVDFGTKFEDRHSEDCVCVVCRDVERSKMGRRTVISGGNGEVFERDGSADEFDGERDESEDQNCRDESDEKSGEHAFTYDLRDDDHDSGINFLGTGEMSQVRISKPFTPKCQKLGKGKEAESSTSAILTISIFHGDGLEIHSALPEHEQQYEVERDKREIDNLEESGNISGVTIAYSPAPSPPLDPGEDLPHERGRRTTKDLHTTWDLHTNFDPQIKNKKSIAKKGLVAARRHLSKRSLSIGRCRSEGKGSEDSGSSRTSRILNFARSLSRRSNNSGNSSQIRQAAEEEHTILEAQMDESVEIEDQKFSFQGRESLHTSFQGDEDIVEHGDGDGTRKFIGPRRNPEIHDFPTFDPSQFIQTMHVESYEFRRRSVSESNASALELENRSHSRSGSRSPSLQSHHYSSRGSFSLNWDNISSDTVYHKHARRFYENPSAYGEEILGYNPETDNPYLAYDRYQEVSEWADSTEEYDPDHVVALTTRELKRLCGEEVPIPFDFIPEGYVNPPNSKSGSVIGDEVDDIAIMGEELDDEKGSDAKHKNLIYLLGMPGWAHEWEEMTKMQRHFHIVAAGDWRMGPVFDVESNYSDYYGVPFFEPNDVGLNGVNRREVRGLDIPGLEELELKFRLEESDDEDEDGYEGCQRRHSDENVDNEGSADYDSDGFLYGDGKRGEITGNFGQTAFRASEAERLYRRPSDGGQVSESDSSSEGSEVGDYAGSVVEGYGTTDDHRTALNINGRIDDSFRARMARGYILTGKLDQTMFTSSNAGSVISEEAYDSDDDEETESDDGVSHDYSFDNSSYHGIECQEDYAIGTSIFAPHAFQLYPPYDAANDCTTIGISPDDIENARPKSWDTDYMEDILGYSVHEGLKPRDPTAEMVLMSYLDPIPKSVKSRSSSGAKSQSRSSTGSLTPVPSPTKSTRTTRSFVPSLRSIPRSFNKNKSLPPTPEIGYFDTFPNTDKRTASIRKASLSTANIAKLNSKTKDQFKTSTQSQAKSKTSSKTKGSTKGKFQNISKATKKSRIPSPPSSTSSSDSNTSYVDLTRSGSAYAVPPAQSLILYLHGHGLSTNHIAFLLQPLDERFLYDSNSSWWPANVLSFSLSPSPIHFPPHTHFTPNTVSQILKQCSGPPRWWEVPEARDPDGKLLPECFKTLQRGMAVRKAGVLVRKVVENFFWWRMVGGIPHGNLMGG